MIPKTRMPINNPIPYSVNIFFEIPTNIIETIVIKNIKDTISYKVIYD
jgi:hypothetical protein